MSANVHNAILGPVLRVGTIPSANATPNFAIPGGTQSLDGGLITNNGVHSGTSRTIIAPACWWIGPDGQNSAPILDRFITDGFKDAWSGCWYDPIYTIWGTIPSVNRQNVKAGVGYLQNLGGAGAFSYSTFPMPLFTNQLFNTGFYSQSTTGNGLYGGYANNFSYSSIDNILLNSKVDSGGNLCTYQSQTTMAMPYGTLGIGGLAVQGAPYLIQSGGTSCPLSPYAQFFLYYLMGPNYRSPNGNIYNMINLNYTWYWFDKDGNWHNSIVSGSGTYLGRLWNGFVFHGMFTNYSGCVYTEDMIIFQPLLDITGNIDFTEAAHFGQTNNFFMTGFGFSYLANYYQSFTPFTQAAYKIYPAFNFSPLIPDKFFVPNVCGCNNSAPILKNGVIQHA